MQGLQKLPEQNSEKIKTLPNVSKPQGEHDTTYRFQVPASEQVSQLVDCY